MPTFYNSISRRNILNEELPAKYYASVISVEQMTERELALRATDEVTLSPLEMEMAFYQFEKQLVYGLLDGKTIHLRDLGTFYLTCNSEGVATEEEVNASIIKKLNIRFRPTAEVRKRINKATLKKISVK